MTILITQEIAPLQANDIESLRRETEIRLNGMQQQIFLLRQFLEPAVINNANTPDVIFES